MSFVMFHLKRYGWKVEKVTGVFYFIPTIFLVSREWE